MFNEKNAEYSVKRKENLKVWKSPKYEKSKETALEIIKKYDNINQGDFWILMNETKSGKMAYTGLIISHNACLKLNDKLPEEDRFKPESVTVNQNGYNGSLVFTYSNEKQGLYEVGEVTSDNCKNAYPYAMALKRCFDRVVLKQTKLAYDGVYSDSEADEFKEPQDDASKPITKQQETKLTDLLKAKGKSAEEFCKYVNINSISDLTQYEYTRALIGKYDEVKELRKNG